MRHPQLFVSFLALVMLQACYKEPVASFDYSYEDNLAPADVEFTNTSTDADKFTWDFGDGQGSSEEHPTHVFYNWDNPTVSLTATGRGGESHYSEQVKFISYYIKNSSSYILYDVSAFFWDGENIIDEFSLGTLTPGDDSDVVITNHNSINVGFKNFDGTPFLVSYAFELPDYAMYYIEITDETEISNLNAQLEPWLEDRGDDLLRVKARKVGL